MDTMYCYLPPAFVSVSWLSAGYLHEVSKCTTRASARWAPFLKNECLAIAGDGLAEVAMEAFPDSPRGCDQIWWCVWKQHFAQDLVLLNR